MHYPSQFSWKLRRQRTPTLSGNYTMIDFVPLGGHGAAVIYLRFEGARRISAGHGIDE